MRPVPSLTFAAEELIELRLLRDMLREALELPEDAPVSRICAEARTAILFRQADEAFAKHAAEDIEAELFTQRMGAGL